MTSTYREAPANRRAATRRQQLEPMGGTGLFVRCRPPSAPSGLRAFLAALERAHGKVVGA
jgi:hypothetical protein